MYVEYVCQHLSVDVLSLCVCYITAKRTKAQAKHHAADLAVLVIRQSALGSIGRHVTPLLGL